VGQNAASAGVDEVFLQVRLEIAQSSNMRRCVVPLVTLWDFFAAANFGMARYYRGLQGDGSELLFDQHIYRSRLGRRLPLPLDLLSKQVLRRIQNADLLANLKGKSWVLGGQQFAHLLPKSYLKTATAVVFDLLELDYPDLDSSGIRIDSLKRQLANIGHARQVVTISQHSKQRIVAHFGIDPERIVVIPLGVDSNRFRAVSRSERTGIRDRLQVPREAFLVLYVGSDQRRKNLVSVVRGLGLLVQSMPELVFVKIGSSQSTSGGESFRSAIRSSELLGHYTYIDYAAECDLPYWYAAADVLVFPSVAEGFGLPCLEAMSCGIPVVTTRCGAIPEVVGDSAVFVDDPYSAGQWSAAIGGAARAPEWLRELSERGRERARRFSWDHAREVFMRVVEGTR
jgi:glycosyltransferase involved in cell wall biosynthesis